jgi:hypothetical protein
MRNCSRDDPEFEQIGRALQLVQQVAKHCDNSIANHKNNVQLIELQKRLGSVVVKPHRKFLFEGTLLRHGKDGNRVN